MSVEPTARRPQMADYGVPVEDPDGLLGWKWAAERLGSNRNFWLVTADGNGRPHAMPVWGVWLSDVGQFWCGCAPSARKLRNMEQNPQVVVAVDNTVEVVSVEGTARLVPADDPHLSTAIGVFVNKYFDDPAERVEQEIALAGASWVCVSPDRAFGVIERPDEFGRRSTRWDWPS